MDANTLSLFDLNGNPIAGNGAYCDGSAGGWPGGAQWVGQVTPYTLGSPPLGLLDGLNGPTFQRLSLSTANGLAGSGGLVVSGCPSACVLTVTTPGFNPLTQSIPLQAGHQFSIWGTTSSLINTQGTSTSGTPYTVATVSATGWTSTPVAIPGSANGDFTTNMNCGPTNPPSDVLGNTQNCVVISLTAYRGNPMWDAIMTTSGIYSLDTSPGYKFVADGGANYPFNGGTTTFSAAMIASVRFFVDKSNVQLLTDIVYFIKNFAKFGGGNWTLNEQYSVGGNGSFGGPAQDAMVAPAWLWESGGSYVTSSEAAAFLDMVYNDLDDPTVTPCSKTNAEVNTGSGHTDVVATGTAQGGTATSITLASSDGQPNDYYDNNVIQVGSNYCTVSASPGYNAATKVATCTSTWTAPTSGQAYTIYGTMTISSIAAGGTATVTGYNTHFKSKLHVGDAIIGLTGGWAAMPGPFPDMLMSWVTAIGSDTSITVANGSSLNYIWSTGAAPAQAWYLPQWQPGDLGLNALVKHNLGILGPQPILYPVNGGGDTNNPPYGPWKGSNFTVNLENGHVIAGLAMASADSRAARDLTTAQSANFDYELAHYMDYSCAFAHSGSFYSAATTCLGIPMFANIMRLSIPTFPAIDSTWEQGSVPYKIFSLYPDLQGGTGISARWGTQTGAGTNVLYPRSTMATGYLIDPVFLLSPTSTNAKYLRSWLASVLPFSMWGYYGMSDDENVTAMLYNDPRIGTSDWTVQPHQYLFQANSAAACASLTGWPCPTTFRGDAVVSRTGFSSLSDSLLLYQSRTWWDDHDNPSNGMLSLYRVGELLGTDKAPPGAGTENDDNTTIGDMLQFGGVNSTVGGLYDNTPGVTPIVRWASANHGSWPLAYGDQNSQYVYVCSDLSGVYTNTVNYAQRCIAHLKPSGGEQIIVQWDSVDVTGNPTSIATHIHYPQSGEPNVSSYPEGHTTCPGAGGCGSLNTSRWIQSLEDGGSDGVNPTRNYGIVTHFLSPGSITVRWDCPNDAECSTSSTYAGGNGHTDRISVCGGSSCGATVNTFESLIVHKVTASLTDTSLTTTALNPDTNWTGVQTTDKVVLMARGGTTHSTISGFTTTHSGTAQYLFGGLTPGVYTVTVGGTPVSGSPFTVAANDNSIEFESVARAVSVNGSGGVVVSSATSSSISGQAVASGNVIIH